MYKSIHPQIRVILVLLSVPLFFLNCATLMNSRPTVDFVDAELVDFTMDHIDLRLKLKLNNPYPIGLPGGAVAGDLSMDGKALTGLTTVTPDVPASGSAVFPLQIRIPFKDIMSIGVEGKEFFNFRAKGTADIKLKTPIPVIGDTLSAPFDYTQKIPAVVPDVTFSNFEFTPPSATSLTPSLAFDLGMKNKAAGKFNVSGFDYQLMMGYSSLIQGKTEQITNSGTESVARIKTSLGLGSLPFALLQGTKNLTVKGKTGLSFPGFANGKEFPINFEKALTDKK